MLCGSLFSGAGGLDLGLARAGFRHAFFCEIDEFRRGVLEAHWPGVPVHADVREVAESARSGGLRALGAIGAGEHALTAGRDGGLDDRLHPEPAGRAPRPRGAGGEPVGGGIEADELHLDLLCGGFPCQDLSVAGKRAGLHGARSGLFFSFASVAESLRPRWLLLENVPGLLSSHGGRDFGILLGTLADIGYGLAWRTVDSRYFGVPQRRRRLFILGAFSDEDPAAGASRCGEVLAVGTRCERHPATSSEERPDFAPAPATGAGNGGISNAVTSKWRKGSGGPAGDEAQNLLATTLSHGSNPNSNMAGRRREDDENLIVEVEGIPGIDHVGPLQGRIGKGRGWTASAEEAAEGNLIAFTTQPDDREGGQGAIQVKEIDTSPALDSTADARKSERGVRVVSTSGVRRLTPVECERLQAWPDEWTNPDGKAADSRRYAAIGDGVTATVSEWIGRRLMQWQ